MLTQDESFVETLANTYLVTNKSNTGITKISLDTEHKKLKVWESCVPKDCDWGITSYQQKNNTITAFYAMGDIKKQLTISLLDNKSTMNAEIKYQVNQKLTKVVSYQLKAQNNRIK
ncbi:hypothetical protein [Pedobacter alpinus]|uniref:Lipocalin-like domain-containing protein n=1 Tax=Pedobacter alpinus TaxID=1590643 RepID=A0ABW5TZ76_9SPHI